jgi:hypothetical protein
MLINQAFGKLQATLIALQAPPSQLLHFPWLPYVPHFGLAVEPGLAGCSWSSCNSSFLIPAL